MSSASRLTRPFEYMTGFDITTNIHYKESSYVLQMYDYEKVPMPRMYLRMRPAEMYPTKVMHTKVYGY